MDSQTRHALKQDKFVQTTQSGVSWVGEHRSTVIRYSVVFVVVLAVLIAGLVVYTQRSEAASSALGSALDVYSAQLANGARVLDPSDFRAWLVELSDIADHSSSVDELFNLT